MYVSRKMQIRPIGVLFVIAWLGLGVALAWLTCVH